MKKNILFIGALLLMVVGSAVAISFSSKENQSEEVQKEESSTFSLPFKKTEPKMVNLVQIGNPLGGDDVAFRFVAPEDDITGSITAITNIDVHNGNIELPSNFIDGFFDTEVMEGKYGAVRIQYTFMSDGMITWENVVPDNEHHKWEDHPEYISVKQGNKAIVTYTYNPETQDWIGSIKILG